MTSAIEMFIKDLNDISNKYGFYIGSDPRQRTPFLEELEEKGIYSYGSEYDDYGLQWNTVSSIKKKLEFLYEDVDKDEIEHYKKLLDKLEKV